MLSLIVDNLLKAKQCRKGQKHIGQRVQHIRHKSFVIFYNILMNDQPIIIEEGVQNSTAKGSLPTTDSEPFYKLFDQVQSYDNLTIEIRKRYEQAMLMFASIKFSNPYALTPNSHRCLPAFLTIKDNQALEYGYNSFTQQIDEDEFPEEFQQQEQIEQECQSKTESLKKGGEESLKLAKETQPLFRFNVLNQQAEVISTANKFRQLLESLLKLIETKNNLEKTFKEIQNKNKEE